jgi:hypothetical protein
VPPSLETPQQTGFYCRQYYILPDWLSFLIAPLPALPLGWM